MDKLKGIKEGDRVRVTFEGIVKATDLIDPKTFLPTSWAEGILIHPRGSNIYKAVTATEINHTTFTIEKLPEPLKAWDRVKWEHITAKAAQELEGEIITTYLDTAWVKVDKRDLPYSVEISRLSKIS